MPVNRIGAAFALAAALAAAPVAASVTEVFDYDYARTRRDVAILGFETGSTGFPTPPDLTIPIAFSGWHGAGTLAYFAANGIPFERFGEQFLGNVSGFPRAFDIEALFHSGTRFVGSWLMWAGNLETIQTVQFSAYDASNTLIFSKALAAPQAFNQIYFYGVLSDQPIHRVVWHPVEDSFFRLDNLAYQSALTSPVPEVPIAPMLATGTLVVMALRAKRRRG